jgi:peptidoglycan/xylan/chitin deacetylase (PgdA/CDA1 family)
VEHPNPQKLAEFETWMSLLTDRSLPEQDKWKAWFCVAEYEQPDFQLISSMLHEHNATGSFAFLGRDVEAQAEIIKELHDDGHEIVFHSHRHHTYADLSYEEAHDAITTGLEAFESETSITPSGFFVPFFEMSDGALQAIEEFDFDWVLGKSNKQLSGISIQDPAWPLDTKRFETQTVEETMDEFREEAASEDGPFLFHPPVIEYHDGLDAFANWIRDVNPVVISDIENAGETGIILDCVRPVRVE